MRLRQANWQQLYDAWLGSEVSITMRIQLELPEDNVRELKALMAKAHIETYKELFGNALTILHWAVHEVEKGRALGSIDEENETYKELVMPILQTIAAKMRATEPMESRKA